MPSLSLCRTVAVPNPEQDSQSQAGFGSESLSHMLELARKRELPPYLEKKVAMMCSKAPEYDEKLKSESHTHTQRHTCTCTHAHIHTHMHTWVPSTPFRPDEAWHYAACALATPSCSVCAGMCEADSVFVFESEFESCSVHAGLPGPCQGGECEELPTDFMGPQHRQRGLRGVCVCVCVCVCVSGSAVWLVYNQTRNTWQPAQPPPCRIF